MAEREPDSGKGVALAKWEANADSCWVRSSFPERSRMVEPPVQQPVSTLLSLRIAVAFLGQRSHAGWWDSDFLTPVGVQYLGLIYPKTASMAAVTSGCEAAKRIHDERIGRGRVSHLFRMPSDAEIGVSRRTAISHQELARLCSSDAATAALAEIARTTAPAPGVGPILLGQTEQAKQKNALSRIAATYARGFREGTQVFPYFA